MKRTVLILCCLLNSSLAFLQIPFLRIVPDSSLSSATSAVITNNIVVLQSENKIYGVDAIGNTNLWFIKLPYWAYAGALSLTGKPGEVFLHALKDGPTQTDILYTIDANTGAIKDSMESKGVPFINVYPIPTNNEEIGFIGQVKGKFTAAMMNKRSGKISQTFFKEGDAGSTIANAMAFSANGKYVAVALINDRYEVRVHSMLDGKLAYTIPVKGTEIHDMEFSSDGKYLYFPDGKENLWIVNTTTQQVENKINTGGKHAHIAISKNDEYAILSGWEGTYIVRINLKTSGVEKSNYGATSFSCTTNETGEYAVVTGRGMGPYFVTKYPYCVLYPISPETSLNENANTTQYSSTASSFKKGDKVQVEWNGIWYKAEIIDITKDKYKIHYEGYGTEWDEWVGNNRMKK